MPEEIILDRDPVFLSLFWSAFFKLQGTALHKSSAYHSQSDGQTENLNRTLEHFLRCTVGANQVLGVKHYLGQNSGINCSSLSHRDDPIPGPLWV